MKKVFGIFCFVTIMNFVLNVFYMGKIDEIKTDSHSKIEKFKEQNETLVAQNKIMSDILLKQEEQISVLEEAVSPNDKRWAKIKKVREAVLATIKSEGFNKSLDIGGLTTYAGAVVDYSEQYDVPIALVLSITAQESAFNPRAVSKAGAQGMMQLMPATAKECSLDVNKNFYNILKIQDNVQLGTWYLSKMLDVFNGDVELAIRAYNAGPVYVQRVLSGEVESYPRETINYHQRVMKFRERFLRLGF